MTTPEQIVPRSPDYRDDAWKQYAPSELGDWVHLLVKRAHHRNPEDRAKIAKDLTDAENYLAMLAAHVSNAKETLLGLS